MTEVINGPSNLSQETQLKPDLAQNGELHSEAQSIITQPVSSFHEVPEMPHEQLEEDMEKKKRRDDDCCCAPYAYDDEDVFFLFRCIAWCCVEIGRCSEACCEGCAECINSCCESNEAGNGGDGCFGGCCDDCDGCGGCDGCDGCDCNCDP